jgi:ABC-type phosphate transport system permease subunit
MTNMIIGIALGFITGVWFHHFTMLAIFKKLKSEIGSREAENWE